MDVSQLPYLWSDFWRFIPFEGSGAAHPACCESALTPRLAFSYSRLYVLTVFRRPDMNPDAVIVPADHATSGSSDMSSDIADPRVDRPSLKSERSTAVIWQ